MTETDWKHREGIDDEGIPCFVTAHYPKEVSV